MGVSVDLPAMQAVAETIKTYPEVRYVGMSAGRYELLVEAFFADQEHLLDFVTKRLGRPAGRHQPGDLDHPEGGEVLLRVGDRLSEGRDSTVRAMEGTD